MRSVGTSERGEVRSSYTQENTGERGRETQENVCVHIYIYITAKPLPLSFFLSPKRMLYNMPITWLGENGVKDSAISRSLMPGKRPASLQPTIHSDRLPSSTERMLVDLYWNDDFEIYANSRSSAAGWSKTQKSTKLSPVDHMIDGRQFCASLDFCPGTRRQ